MRQDALKEGDVAAETRSLRAFSEVVLRGYGELVIEQVKEGPEEVLIEADETLMTRIGSEVIGSRLVLGLNLPWYEWLTWWMTWLFLPNKHIRCVLKIRSLEEMALQGSGSISCNALRGSRCRMRISGSGAIVVGGIDVESVETRISGSGSITCSGTARGFEARISGSGRVRADGLQCARAEARISGSGDISLFATERLDVRISGSGKVSYSGDPRIDTSISGSGRVRRK
jgi:hypothetical protein